MPTYSFHNIDNVNDESNYNFRFILDDKTENVKPTCKNTDSKKLQKNTKLYVIKLLMELCLIHFVSIVINL